MNELELYFDGSTAVEHFDAQGLVPTTAALTLFGPNGETLQSPTVTKSTISTTVQAGSTALVVNVASAAGMVRGTKLAIVSGGVTYVVEVASVATLAVTLYTALPVAPETGSTVKGLTMTATITAPGAALVGPGLRLAWVYSSASAAAKVGYPASVVRWPWVNPVTSTTVREVMSGMFGQQRTEAFNVSIAERANSKLRGAILQTGRRPWLYLGPQMFTEAADKAVRYVLAEDGLVLGSDPYGALREMRFAFQDAMQGVLAGAASYDSNADGVVSPSELRPMHFSIRAVR